ncbi:hypothetical protein KY309_02560 [Candidatus Woesearchaeota archaeon]|nr:hypothetical protein [Candidatus Woesearchaeota archaeon]MBW3016468.1 hypothetical protein [Candidatus Woesearchaeota archaeon]
MSFKDAYMRHSARPQELFGTEAKDCEFTLYCNEGCYYLKGQGPPEPMLDFFLILHHFSSKESRFITFVHSELGHFLRKKGAPSLSDSHNHYIITREQLQDVRANVKHLYYSKKEVDFGTMPWQIVTLPPGIKDEQVEFSMLKESPLRVGLPPAGQSRYDLVNRLTDGQEIHQVTAIDFAIKSWRAGIYDKLQ